jgi:hypothetical protein
MGAAGKSPSPNQPWIVAIHETGKKIGTVATINPQPTTANIKRSQVFERLATGCGFELFMKRSYSRKATYSS